MKTPLVCRSCGETEYVDLGAVADRIICTACEHESAAGDAGKRRAIQSQQAKVKTLSWAGGALAATALTAVLVRVFLLPETSLGIVLWSAAGLCFAGAAACAILAEQGREVVYF